MLGITSGPLAITGSAVVFRGDACAFARARSFTLLSVWGVFHVACFVKAFRCDLLLIVSVVLFAVTSLSASHVVWILS